MQVDVVGALPAGTNAIGKLAANSGVDIGDVDVTSISAGSNLIGDVGIQARTSGGLSIARDVDLDETELEVKASAGQLFGWYIYNDGAADVSVKIYDATAANVTVGTTTPVLTFTIPAGSAGNVHNFGGQNFNLLTVANTGAPINLYWSDPLGGSSNDYDLFRLNAAGTALAASSTNIQNGTQDPFEQISQSTVNPRVVIVKKTGAAGRFLHLNANRGRFSIVTPIRWKNESG